MAVEAPLLTAGEEATEEASAAAMGTLLGLAVNLPGGKPSNSNEHVLLCGT